MKRATSDGKLTRSERAEAFAARSLRRLPVWLQLRLSGRPAVVVEDQTLDPHVQLLLAIHLRRRPRGLCHPTPEEARVRFRRDLRASAGPKTRVRQARDFHIAGEAGPLKVRHYAPFEAQARDLLVYQHGGGFVVGDLETHDEVCRLLCLHAATHVLGVDYRLAPEHPFPAGLEDALAALRWAQAHADELGADAARVALGGDSAGGNLTAAAARIASLEASPPLAQLLIYPATDGLAPHASRELFGEGFFLSREDCEAFYHYYTEGTGVSETDPRVAPLRAPDHSGLPPALVVTAGFDVLRDEGEAYAAALREAGTAAEVLRFPALGHGFINMTGVSPAARRATVEIARTWRALLDRNESRIEK